MLGQNKIYLGDCLEIMKDIEDKSINLIIIDPPYNIKKAEWDKWKTIDNYIEWMGLVFKECERILKDNGSFYFFHNDFEQMAELQHWLKVNTTFVFKNLITIDKRKVRVYNWKDKTKHGAGFWKNENVYKYYQTEEYLLFYNKYDEKNNRKNYDYLVVKYEKYIKYMNEIKNRLNLNLKELNQLFGYVAGCNWWFNYKQPRLINEKDYIKLRDIYPLFSLNYTELIKLIDIKDKETNIFNLSDNISTTWDWEFIKNRKHPTQKPIGIIENIILHSSNENDIILDCFLGSGTTAVACINTNRNYIGIEKDENYYKIACGRIENS